MSISAFLHTGVVFIALSAASMAVFFSILFFKIFSLTYFLIIFLLTYAVYGMDRLASLEEDRLSHPERACFLQRNRWGFALSTVLAFSASFLLAAVTSGWVAVLIPIAPIAVIFYSGNLSQKVLGTRRPQLKKYFIVKDVTIASGWAFLLVVTSVYAGRSIRTGEWLFLVPLLMKLSVMAAVYDFKDIDSDRRTRIRTLPIVVGEDTTKLVLHTLNAVATVMILLLVYFGFLPLLGVVFVPAFVYQFFMIHLVRKDASEWIYLVLCDLEQFFWLIFLVIGGLMIGYS